MTVIPIHRSGAAWNFFCVVYLLRNPRLDPLTGAPLAPHPAFVYPLLALVCFPLAIGVVTGCAALWSEGEVERREREERGRPEEVAIWLGIVGALTGSSCSRRARRD